MSDNYPDGYYDLLDMTKELEAERIALVRYVRFLRLDDSRQHIAWNEIPEFTQKQIEKKVEDQPWTK